MIRLQKQEVNNMNQHEFCKFIQECQMHYEQKILRQAHEKRTQHNKWTKNKFTKKEEGLLSNLGLNSNLAPFTFWAASKPIIIFFPNENGDFVTFQRN